LYKGLSAGLYPNGANSCPPIHQVDGIQIATNQILPLDSAGNVNTNTGKIVLLSLGMSNTTQEWASGDNLTHNITNAFKFRADHDPSKNPQLVIVDGAISGQDAIQWTNPNAGTWSEVITQRLVQAGVTTNQVQAMWLKEALADPRNYGAFPLHAQALQSDLEIIARIAKSKYPNLKLIYLSCRTHAYDTNSADLNPEPFAFETAFADKWAVQDQIAGQNNLNFNPSNGPVLAPWISWGPYIWVDGTVPRSDGLVWPCSDVQQTDFTHPSSNGVYSVATQLLAFFKTDPTTTPWFLRKSINGSPPTCAPAADVTNGVMPLTVHLSANASAVVPFKTEWTFGDGDFSTNANPTKIFPSPGLYYARVTVTDTNGNTAQGSIAINVTSTVDLWKQAVFTPTELTNPAVSGDVANPDGDGLPNLLEYAMGTNPNVPNTNGPPNFFLTNGVFSLTYTQFQPATDVSLVVEVSNDLLDWNPVSPAPIADEGIIQVLAVQEMVSMNSTRFFRFRANRL
jgi:PKD repeat protein